jgi:hypothetical protein
MHRLIVIAQCAEEHFDNILKEMPIIFSDKVRLVFIDDSYMDIRCPDNVLDLYHRRNCNEGINSHLKDHLEVEVHLNGKGLKNIDLHVTECCILRPAVAFTRFTAWNKRKSCFSCISDIGGEKKIYQ